jgi:DMSO reductase anchor subunit
MSGHTSYIIFTVFSQMAVGALIAMVIADFLAKSKEDAKFFETGAWVSVPVVIIGLIAMLSHEARPFLAMMTMNNHLATSWLSREVLALTLFVILAVIYTVLWLFEPEYGSLKWFPVIPKIAKIFYAAQEDRWCFSCCFGCGSIPIRKCNVVHDAHYACLEPAHNSALLPRYYSACRRNGSSSSSFSEIPDEKGSG